MRKVAMLELDPIRRSLAIFLYIPVFVLFAN